MELHKKIKENRIQEICDKYIGKSIEDNKPISEKDVATLSCAELVVLYYNTEWIIERSNGADVDTGLENQILLMDLIKERVKTSTLYVIYTDATNLPFLTENKSILVYTEKRFADMVACSFNVEYFKESIRFTAMEITADKETYWNKLKAAGINTISVDGTKFTLETDELVTNKEKYENTEFCRFLIQYAQAIRLGIHRDKTSIFQEAILSKLKENPKMIHGSIISKGKNKFIPIYVNASSINETVNTSKLKTENFYALCKEIFNNKNITGIVLNPEREHIVVPREKILEAFAHLNAKVKSNTVKSSGEEQIKNAIVQCSKCGKLWQVEKLDSNGVCPVCLKEEQAKRNVVISTASSKTSSTRWVRCKKCGVAWPPAKLNNDGLCPNCVHKKQNTTPPAVKTATSSTVGKQKIYNVIIESIIHNPKILGVLCIYLTIISVLISPHSNILGFLINVAAVFLGIKSLVLSRNKNQKTDLRVVFGVIISAMILFITIVESPKELDNNDTSHSYTSYEHYKSEFSNLPEIPDVPNITIPEFKHENVVIPDITFPEFDPEKSVIPEKTLPEFDLEYYKIPD